MSCADAEPGRREAELRRARLRHFGLAQDAIRPGIAQQPERAVEVALDVVADGDHANRVPLPEGRCLHPHAGDLPAPPVVGVEVEVILERVGPDDVVLAVVEPEHDPA